MIRNNHVNVKNWDSIWGVQDPFTIKNAQRIHLIVFHTAPFLVTLRVLDGEIRMSRFLISVEPDQTLDQQIPVPDVACQDFGMLKSLSGKIIFREKL